MTRADSKPRPELVEPCPRCGRPGDWDGDSTVDDVAKSFWWCPHCRQPFTATQTATAPEPSLFDFAACQETS